MMKATISDLKNRLSARLREVRSGGTVLVSDRDRSIERPAPLAETDGRLCPNPETEAIARQGVIECDEWQGRKVCDVHERNLGYDMTSLDIESGKLRIIEVKGLSAAVGQILLTPNERRVAEDRRDCYWLCVVTNCDAAPELQEPVRDPARFPWNEVTKVAHYWLEVDAMTRPMGLREEHAPYRSGPESD